MQSKAIFLILAISFALLFAGCTIPNIGGSKIPDTSQYERVSGTPNKGNTNPQNITITTHQNNSGNTSGNGTNANNGSGSANGGAGGGTNAGGTNGAGGGQDTQANGPVGIAYADPDGGRSTSKKCIIKVDPQVSPQDADIGVDIDAYSPEVEQVTFNCGDEVRNQGYGAHFQDRVVCHFTDTGFTSVWLALDGRVCATAPLRFYNMATMDNKLCQVLSPTLKDVSGAYSRNISGSVYLANQKPDSVIKWNCGQKKFSQRVGDLIYGGNSDTALIIGCYFPSDPGNMDSIPVSIDSTPCGDLIPSR